MICLYGWPDHPVWKLQTSGLGVRTTTTDEMQKGISAAVGINSSLETKDRSREAEIVIRG